MKTSSSKLIIRKKIRADILEERSKVLAAKMAQMPDTVENTELVQEIVEATIVLEEVNPKKHLSFSTISKKILILSQMQMTTIDEFSELPRHSILYHRRNTPSYQI